MKKKFSQVRLKGYKPPVRKPEFRLKYLSFVVVFLALAFFVSQNLSELLFKQRLFCDNDKVSDRCIECPRDAVCQNGRIQSCLDNKMLIKGQCVQNQAL